MKGEVEKDYSQDATKKILDDVMSEGNIQKYVDFPIQVEGAIPIANSNFFKDSDVGLEIENITLIDDTGREYKAKLDFSMRNKKPVVTIKTVSVNKDAVAYRMTDEAVKRIVLQESKTKDSKLKEWYERESKKDGSYASSKESVAGLIESAIILAKTLKPDTDKGKKAKAAFTSLLRNKNRKIANMKAEEIGKLLDSAIMIHLDHFHTSYKGDVSLFTEDSKEIKRLEVIISQFEGALLNGPPKSIPLKKYDENLKPIKGHYFSYPEFKKGIKGYGMGIDVSPRTVDGESRLSKKDAEETLRKSPSVVFNAKRVGSKFNELEERAVRSVLDLAKEKKKSLDTRYNAQRTDNTSVDYKITVQGYRVSKAELSQLIEKADKAIKEVPSNIQNIYSLRDRGRRV